MKRTLVIILVILSATTLFAQAKWGGIARQVAMGGSSGGSGLVLNPFIWEDPAYMLLNPAYQTMYKNYLWTNIGGGTLAGLSTADNGYGKQNAGINFGLSKELTVGVILSHDPSAANTVSGLIAGGGGLGFPFSIAQRTPQSIPAIANVWEAVASLDAGALDLGFGFSYGTSNFDTSYSLSTTPTASMSREASSSMIGFRAGGLLDLGGGNALDFGAALRLDKANDKIKDGFDYSVSGTEIQAHARLKLKMSNRVNFLPYAAFGTVSAEPKEDSKPATATATPRHLKASTTTLGVGGGIEYKTTDVYIAGGVSFQTSKGKIETSSDSVGGSPRFTTDGTLTYTAIPVFNIGAEWWFLDWLAGRAGYFRSLGKQNIKIESSTTGSSATWESNRTVPNSFLLAGGLNAGTFDGIVTLGLGFRFGNFSLDATVSEEALRRGFGLVGAQDNINSFGFMNASYNFE